MAVTVAGLRVQSVRRRESGWSYRRIARDLQQRHRLNALLAFRLAHGWTQEEAARRWNERWSGEGPPKTGKNFSYWEAWPARGGRAPSQKTLLRLAELYLCRPGDLVDGEDFGARDTGSDSDGAEAVGEHGGAGGAGWPPPVQGGAAPAGEVEVEAEEDGEDGEGGGDGEDLAAAGRMPGQPAA
jgi:hypothetical protein